ncbi:MAG: hypothetical protein SCK28_10135, partial [Bacillota bacterium]|nr:hypothetical protein [Bacillota bacterium]
MIDLREGLLASFVSSPICEEVVDGINQGLHQQLVYGLTGSQQSFFMASIATAVERPIIVVAHEEGSAKNTLQELSSLLPDREVLFLPKKDLVQAAAFDAGNQLNRERIKVLAKIINNPKIVVVTGVENLGQRLPCGEVFSKGFIHLKLGQLLPPGLLAEKLFKLGYERVDLVEVPGQFSLRGGILDCFSLHQDKPIRIEYFDDEIDSIRTFDQQTQRSLEQIDNCEIVPAVEFFLEEPEALNNLVKTASKAFLKHQSDFHNQGNDEAVDNYTKNYQQLLDSLGSGSFHAKLEQAFSLMPEYTSFIGEFFPIEPLIFVAEPSRCWEE